jgi:Cd2+/Zn2+-exporting ATPase
MLRMMGDGPDAHDEHDHSGHDDSGHDHASHDHHAQGGLDASSPNIKDHSSSAEH